MQRFLDLFISISCSTCFRRFLRPSSGAYSFRYCQTNTAACCYRGWDGTYMFQAVPSPIIRSTKLYIQRQVLSNQYCCNCGMRWNLRFANLLRSWVRIPPGAWIFVCCECRVLSGRGLCGELMNRPEESYRLCCVVVCDLETSRIGAPYIYIYIYVISSLRVKELGYKYVDSNRISQLRDKWQERSFGFNKLLVIYWLAKQLLASQEKYREYSD